MFVSGWESDGGFKGKHKSIKSEELSQGKRQFGGGRKIAQGSKGFGPRDRNKEIQEVEESKKKMEGKSYGPIIQKAGSYVTTEDLKGISDKWKDRDFGLETQILELYKPRSWWIEKLGQGDKTDRVAMEIDLSGLKKMLETEETSLKGDNGKYGKVVDNYKLRIVRALGDPENVLGNYIKRYAGGHGMAKKYIKEVNLVGVVAKLMNGDEVGFDCEKDEKKLTERAFSECKENSGVSANGAKVKSVLKTVVPNIAEKYIPKRDGGGDWKSQHYEGKYGNQLYKSNDFEGSKVINEKCEPNNGFSFFADQSLTIRQEVCDLVF